MSQYNTQGAGTGPSHNSGSTGFFAKIKDNYGSKFSNLSISNQFNDKDGNSADDTLVHNAFVKYFDKNNQAYPEWLGVVKPPQNSQYNRRAPAQTQYAQGQYSNSELQPVRQNNTYNNSYSQNQQNQQNYQQQQQYQTQDPAQTQDHSPHPQQQLGYQGRTSSRLQDMYNKSRQQSIPGQGYNSQLAQPSRNNSTSVSGSRLRERMLNSSHSSANQHVQPEAPQQQSSQGATPRATWGRR